MEDFFENELINRFERMVEQKEYSYFESDEYEDIIIYYLEIGDIAYAAEAIKIALQTYPNSIELKIKQLELFLEQERYKESKILMQDLEPACFDKIDFLVCCAKYYSALGNSKRAIEYCQTALTIEDEDQNFLYDFIGDEYYSLEDYANALASFKSALQCEPWDEYALESVIECYRMLHKKKEAVKFIQNFIDGNSFSEFAWFLLGQTYFSMKKYREAIEAYDYALAIDDEWEILYNEKALCFEFLNEWENAAGIYGELLNITETKSPTFFRIGLCYKQLSSVLPAAEAFEAALREDPQHYPSMMELSEIFMAIGNLREALHFAREAVYLNSENPEYIKRLAYLYLENDKFDDGIAALEKLVKLEPNRFNNWYAYSETLILAEEYEEAITVLNSALKFHQKRAEFYYQLSSCYTNIGDRERGKQMLDIATYLAPKLLSEMQKKYPDLKLQETKTKSKRKAGNIFKKK